MASAPSERLLSFRVAGEALAIPAGTVREVIRAPALVRVPHAPGALAGLGNLRGQVLSVVSLATLLDRPAGTGKRVIVLDNDQGIGLLVDEVSALIGCEQAQGSDRIARPIDIAALLDRGFVAATARKPRQARMATVEARAVAADQIILLAFAVAGQEFALPLDQLDEVIRLPEGIALLPQADDAVVGSAAHRGALLPLLSLRHLLSLPATAQPAAPRVVVARLGRHKVGLVVDAVHAILRVGEQEIDMIPAVLTRGAGEARIQAVCRLDGGRRLVSLLAANQLLRDDLVARLADDQQGQGGQQEQDAMADAANDMGVAEQFLLFRIGDDDFGLPVAAVAEVVRMPDSLGTLPRAPKFVEGIMNLRGRAIPVIDQRRRFDAPAEAGQRRRVIIVTLGEMQAGFVVDAVSDVIRVGQADLQPAPDLGDGAVRIFDRVATVGAEQRMILLVQPRELLDRAEKDLLAAMLPGDASTNS
jgi:purine-binding chemotaxis protein CheW